MSLFIRIEAPPAKFEAEITTTMSGSFNIEVFHILHDYEINAAFENWQARIENPNQITSKHFANYIMSKNHMAGHLASDTEDGLNKLIYDAMDNGIEI